MCCMDFVEAKIEVYIPEKYVERLRNKLNEAGAGKIGNYDNCMTVINVKGYWRPLEDAKPFEGEIGEICEEKECKIEVRCRRECIEDAIEAIKEVHPYEEPVINIVPLVNNLFAL